MKKQITNPVSGKPFEWNGQPIDGIAFGYVVQTKNKNQPLYWYNWEIEKQRELGMVPCIIPAVEITQSGQKFTISNIAGLAIQKLEAGGMWTHPHMSLDGKFYRDNDFAVYEYSREDNAVYQAGLEKWQEETNPEAFKKLKALKDLAKNKPVGQFFGEELGLFPKEKQGKSGLTSLHLKFRKGKK